MAVSHPGGFGGLWPCRGSAYVWQGAGQGARPGESFASPQLCFHCRGRRVLAAAGSRARRSHGEEIMGKKSSGLGQSEEEPSRSVRIEAFDEFLQWLCFTRAREKEREGKKEKGKAVNLTE